MSSDTVADLDDALAAPNPGRGSDSLPAPARRPTAGTSGLRRSLAEWLAGLTSLAVFGMSGALFVTYQSFDGNLEKVDITHSATPSAGRAVTSGGATIGAGTHPAMNVLLVGIDDRSGLTEEQVAEASTGSEESGLADTIILAHIPAKATDGDQDRAVLVSIPRDAYVRVPGHGQGKINSSYLRGGKGDGGAQLLVQTVANLSGLTIDHYVQVDLRGFLFLSDAIGGVDVCLKKPVNDRYTNLRLPAGPQTLQGAEALKFVRQRHGLPQGDLDRITRQQAFLAAALRKVTSAGTLLNPVRVNGLLNAATAALTVDETLSVGEMRDLAFSMREIAAGNVEFRTIPTRGLAMRDEQSVVLLDDKKLPGFFAELGESDHPEVDPTLTVAPADVRVRVLNGTTRTGTASEVDAALERRGFYTIETPANADASTYRRSQIRYGPGQAEAARTLAAGVAGAELVFDPRLTSSVTLIVGWNFTGVTAVAVAQPATPANPPTPSSSPYESRFADDTSCVY